MWLISKKSATLDFERVKRWRRYSETVIGHRQHPPRASAQGCFNSSHTLIVAITIHHSSWLQSSHQVFEMVRYRSTVQTLTDRTQGVRLDLEDQLRHRFVQIDRDGDEMLIPARPLTNTAIALRPATPTPSIQTRDFNPSTSMHATAVAQQGSNQLSLETPRNGAGAFVFHARTWMGILNKRARRIGEGTDADRRGS